MLKNKALIVLAAVGIGADASSAVAQSMYGSDTLFKVTRDAVAQAVADTGGASSPIKIDYKGTGSSQGGKAMNGGDASANPAIPAQNQQIAPQSRFLKDSECGAAIGAGPGSSLRVGLDAIGVFKATDAGGGTQGCNTLRYTPGTVSGVNITDWRSVLRLLYAGQTSPAAATACADPGSATPSTAGALSRCDSTERRTLISNWNVLFQDGGCANGTCPNGLRHAFRRDDSSGTTDTFLSILELPGVQSAYNANNRTFCNGDEFEDLDPVRTPCDAKEDACQTIPYANRTAPASNPSSAGGDLGVVLPITMPVDTTKQYGNPCAFGKFKYTSMPFAASQELQRCPDGNGRSAGKCRWPTDAAGNFNCTAVAGTKPPIRVFTNMDGRSYNLLPRDPATGNLLINPPSGTSDPRWMAAGAYRLHQVNVMSNATGASPCKKDDATLQIGCLTTADPCTIGYAGLQGDQGGTNVNPVALGTPDGSQTRVPNRDDTNGAINALTSSDCSVKGKRYSLARSLYMAASKGMGDIVNFANISDAASASGSGVAGEQTYLKWIAGHKGSKSTAGTWDNILYSNGYVPLANGFDEVKCVSTTKAQ